jgi:hypothetical protein
MGEFKSTPVIHKKLAIPYILPTLAVNASPTELLTEKSIPRSVFSASA